MSHFTTQPSSSRFIPQPYEGHEVSTESSAAPATTCEASSQRYFSSSATSTREASEFINQYDLLALRHGLKRLDAANLAEPAIPNASSIASRNSPKAPRRWFSRKVLRRAVSSKSLSGAGVPLQSITTKRISLEKTARLAGVSVLRLDRAFFPSPLTLPNAIYVMATYLQDQAQTTPEIFQAAGSHLTVIKICDHLNRHLRTTRTDDVDQTVGLITLPNHIDYTVHDVASAFKRLLTNTSGGILGSMGVFHALRDIETKLRDADAQRATQTKARLIALAISSVTSKIRFSVICAVLGLVAMVAESAGPLSTEERLSNMTPPSAIKALSTIFGPLLLSSLFDEIDVLSPNERSALQDVATPAQTPRKSWNIFRSTKGQPSFTHLEASSAADHVRYEQCAAIVEMLLSNWKEINRQLKQLSGPKGLENPFTVSQSEQEHLSSFSSHVHPEPSSEGPIPFSSRFSFDVESRPLKIPLGVEADTERLDDEPMPRPVGIQNPPKNSKSGRWLPVTGDSTSTAKPYRETARGLNEVGIARPYISPPIYQLPRTPVTADNLAADDLFWDFEPGSVVDAQIPPHDSEALSSSYPEEYPDVPSRPKSTSPSLRPTVHNEFEPPNTLFPLGWVPVLDHDDVVGGSDEDDSGSEPINARLSLLSDDGDYMEPTDFESAMKRVERMEREKDWWMNRALMAEGREKRMKKEHAQLKEQAAKLREWS